MRIVYQDRWLIAVDKPAGLPSQATRADEAGVFELLSATFPYVGLHHRLDRAASGLLLLTLDRAANAPVSRAFKRRQLHRIYLAAVDGEVVADRWERPVGGQSARTAVAVIGREEGRSLLELRLDTGRTHQIRQHGALEGHPLLGDRRYGGDSARAWPRLALHAFRLEGPHPVTGEALRLEAPIPEDLADLFGPMRGTR
ncbi:MAG: RluA family pseudouridine synthase [Deltaproteobacteria bacterium]|nr:RluA family pseudouridine synthase [Deltaproteobacteria bacterium]